VAPHVKALSCNVAWCAFTVLLSLRQPSPFRRITTFHEVRSCLGVGLLPSSPVCNLVAASGSIGSVALTCSFQAMRLIIASARGAGVSVSSPSVR